MTLAMHLCLGNFTSTHAAAGNHEPVAEALLAEMNLDAYFMEYDDARSGDFRPLRFPPKNKVVVLGLVTTKFAAMESKDDLAIASTNSWLHPHPPNPEATNTDRLLIKAPASPAHPIAHTPPARSSPRERPSPPPASRLVALTPPA